MNPRNLFIGGSLLGLAVGSVAGYFFAKKRMEQQYAEAVVEEVIAAKKYYSLLYKKNEFATPAAAVEELQPKAQPEFANDDQTLKRIVEGLKYVDPKSPPVQTVNVFDGKEDDADVDYSEEDAARDTENGIYVIDIDEFMNSEVGYTEVTLTYFAGDNVLVNEQEMPVEDVAATVGKDNLAYFGYRSKDPKVVYIRNNVLQLDFEVVRSEGKYSEEVAGFAPALTKRKTRT